MDKILHDNGGRRSGIDRHQYLYNRISLNEGPAKNAEAGTIED
jgi:hypothetical protein